MSYYYDIEKDMKDFPEYWSYIIIGGRSTGKTYSCLKSCYINKRKFVFAKRTQEDVKLLCSGSIKSAYTFDLSPFKPINRDLGCNVKAVAIEKGLGAFYECDDEDNPYGEPLGYIIALSAVTKFKGFDMSDADWLILDEFIPNQYDRVNRQEGLQILDLYRTIARDREHRGKEPLKLIALANATKLSNPLMDTLEVTDDIVNIQQTGGDVFPIASRGIFIHMINDNEDFRLTEEKSAIYKAMRNTQWGKMSLDNEFAYDDTSNVNRINLKKYSPRYRIRYKQKYYYGYCNEYEWFITDTPTNKKVQEYDMEKDNDCKKFYIDYVIDTQTYCMNGHVSFKYYSLYDLFMEYKKIFRL